MTLRVGEDSLDGKSVYLNNRHGRYKRGKSNLGREREREIITI